MASLGPQGNRRSTKTKRASDQSNPVLQQDSWGRCVIVRGVILPLSSQWIVNCWKLGIYGRKTKCVALLVAFILIIPYFFQIEPCCNLWTGCCIMVVMMACCIRSSWTSSSSSDSIESHPPLWLSCLIIIVSSPTANRPGLRATRWFTHTVSNQGAGCETPRLCFLSWLSVNICSLMSHLAELLMLTPSKYRSARMCVSVCFWPGFFCRYFRKKKFWFYKCGYLHLLLIKLFPFSWAHCNFKWYDSLWDFIFF